MMRYLIITDKPAFSNWLLQPDWSQIRIIIDLATGKYVTKEFDRNGQYISPQWFEHNLDWQEIEEDSL